MPTSRDPHLHKGHRQRMKEQFLEHGLSHFNEHQKLELLLFFAIPQKDTNEIAHRLLNACNGDICSVLECSRNDLMDICGIGENSAVLISLVFELIKYYNFKKTFTDCKISFRDLPTTVSFFQELLSDAINEEIHAVALTDDLRLIREKKLAEGSPDCVTFKPRTLMDFVTSCRCNRVILAHNHPRGSFTASLKDVRSTRLLVDLFKKMSVDISDHIVIGKGGYQSLHASGSASKIWKKEDDLDEFIEF